MGIHGFCGTLFFLHPRRRRADVCLMDTHPIDVHGCTWATVKPCEQVYEIGSGTPLFLIRPSKNHKVLGGIERGLGSTTMRPRSATQFLDTCG